VDVCDCASRVKLRRLRGAGVHSLELALSFNVGNRQPLPGGQYWIAGVVLAQSLIELMRTRVLPLDACQDFCELFFYRLGRQVCPVGSLIFGEHARNLSD